MKKILLLVLALTASVPFVHAQQALYKTGVEKNKTTDNYTFEQVVPVKGITKEEMYARAKKWMSTDLFSGGSNARYDDAKLTIGRTAKAELEPASGYKGAIADGRVNYNLKLEFKKGSYHFVFDNLIIEVNYGKGIGEMMVYENAQKDTESARHIRKEVNEKLSAIAAGLEAAIKNAPDRKVEASN
jgi:hypothetical protein